MVSDWLPLLCVCLFGRIPWKLLSSLRLKLSACQWEQELHFAIGELHGTLARVFFRKGP